MFYYIGILMSIPVLCFLLCTMISIDC